MTAIVISVTALAEPPPYDFARESAWARSIAGAALQGIRLQSPVAKLLAWIPRRGQVIDTYLFTPGDPCRRVALQRRADPSDPTATDRLSGTLYRPTEPSEGKPVRSTVGVAVGDELEIAGEGGFEVRDADGSWHAEEVGTIGRDDDELGALSFADDRVARFDGEPITIDIICLGPIDRLSCASGGEQLCNRCQRLRLEVQERLVYTVDPHARPRSEPGLDNRSSCRVPCPETRPSGKYARLAAWLDHVSAWEPRHTPRDQTPSLYRHRADCVREHRADVTEEGADPR
jgi:hypothetical protein